MVHHCKECGRGFDSMRAMFGHMKSHSKRVKVVNIESAERAEDAAKILVMLSRDVMSCSKFNSKTESSDDDSAYFGAVSSCRRNKSCGDDGDSLIDSDEKKLKNSLSTEKLQFEYFSSGYANSLAEKNITKFDLKFVAGD
ncbi:hypothetical protein C2S51_023210 [Perilla frutescens var. frutescens]|nr:hypothetical protein C2S51_023210 [Perilla frutescens var. frutescens]